MKFSDGVQGYQKIYDRGLSHGHYAHGPMSFDVMVYTRRQGQNKALQRISLTGMSALFEFTGWSGDFNDVSFRYIHV